MWTTALLLILIVLLLLMAFRLNKQSLENCIVLRHTIGINLDILEGELSELHAIALAAPQNQAQEKAAALLQQSKATAQAVRSRLPLASHEQLESMLGLVFAAMNQSTDARRLLNACRPRQ